MLTKMPHAHILNMGAGDSDDDSDDGVIFGFSEDDCYELACQGIKPWDPEAGATLAVLNGCYDYWEEYSVCALEMTIICIALDKALLSIKKYLYFSYFSTKTYVVGTH